MENKSIILAMIALLFALGFCSGPKSCYYGVGDNRNTNTPGEEYRVENCRGQQDAGWCNGMMGDVGPTEIRSSDA